MTIKVKCGQCKKNFRVDEKYAGETVKCPFCPNAVDIPDEAALSEERRSSKQVEVRLVASASETDEAIAVGLTDAQRRLKSFASKARHRQEAIEHLMVGLLLVREQVLHYATPNWAVLASRIAMNLALFAALIFIDIMVFLPENMLNAIVCVLIHLCLAGFSVWLMHRAWTRTLYVLTNLRVLSRSGLFAVTVKSIPLDKLHAISSKSNLLEKKSGIGSLKFYV